MRRPLVALMITLSLPLGALAADKGQNFAAKGFAALPCATFVEERKNQTQTHNEAMAWLTGYISAYNHLSPDTYDVVPWQSAELLSALLAEHCSKHQDETFLSATNKLLNSIAEDRLRTASDIVTLTVGGYTVNIYRDMVFRVQSALKEKGYLKTKWPTGDYDEATVAAMKAFQTANKLEATGVPDQQSLYLLFMK